MKKKFFLRMFAASIIIAVAIVNVSINKQSTLSPRALQNQKALAGGGNMVYCFSRSEVESRALSYDCGRYERYNNAKTAGSSLTCTAPVLTSLQIQCLSQPFLITNYY
jgi:hypothetical protein